MLGCDQGQGYWWSKPVSVQQATELLVQFGSKVATTQEIDHDQH